MTATLERVAARLQAHAASHPPQVPVVDDPKAKHLRLYQRGVITQEECEAEMQKLGTDLQTVIFGHKEAEGNEPAKQNWRNAKDRTAAGRKFVDLFKRNIITGDELDEQLALVGRSRDSYGLN